VIEDLFNAESSGEDSQPDDQAQGDPLADLLGGLLGGGTSSGTADLAGMLGGGSSEQGDSMAALAGMLGGGSSEQGDSMAAISGGMGSNDLLAPIVNGISEKLGLPPDIVRMIVAFVIGKLLSGESGAGIAAQSEGSDLSSLLNQLGSGRGLDAGTLQSTGMNEELAQQTGLDADTAARSLQEVLKALGGQMS
jgi:hypothetical protein